MRGFRSIIDVTTACGVFACSHLWLSLFEVQSILDVGSSCSVHLRRCRILESYRSALRRSFDICSIVLIYSSMIPRKAGKFSLPGLKRHTGELFPFI